LMIYDFLYENLNFLHENLEFSLWKSQIFYLKILNEFLCDFLNDS